MYFVYKQLVNTSNSAGKKKNNDNNNNNHSDYNHYDYCWSYIIIF